MSSMTYITLGIGVIEMVGNIIVQSAVMCTGTTPKIFGINWLVLSER